MACLVMIWNHANEAVSDLSLVCVELQVGMKLEGNCVYCLTGCVMTCQVMKYHRRQPIMTYISKTP